MTSILNVIGSSLNIHMKQTFARATFRFIIIFQPILYSFLLYMLLMNSDNSNKGEYIVISAGLMNLWSSIIFSSAGDIERERFMGTLELIYITPSDFRIIFLGKVLGNIILGLFSMLLSFATVFFVFGLNIEIKNPFAFFFIFILAMISFAGVSLMMALIFTLSRNSRVLMNCLEYPIFILCGIVFPISVLPYGLEYISYLLSPTWAVMLLRESMTGIENSLVFYQHAAILIVITICYFLIVILFFKKTDKNTRIKGTLGAH